MKNNALQVAGLAHIGVPCANIDKSMSFYESIGFQQMVYKRALNGYHVAMMRNSGCTIELYEACDREEHREMAARKNGHVDHIALFCTGEIEAAYASAMETGCEIVSNGIESTELWGEISRYFILLGPDSERIEISER